MMSSKAMCNLATFEQVLAEVNVLLQLPYPQRDKLRREILRLAAESPLPVEDFVRGLPSERLKEIGENLGEGTA